MSYGMFIGTLAAVGLAIYGMYLVAKFEVKKPGKRGDKAYKLKNKLETIGVLYFFVAFGFAAVCVLAEWSDIPEVINTEVVGTLDVTDFVTFVDKNNEPLYYVVSFDNDDSKTSKVIYINESTLECDEKDISTCEVTEVTTKRTGIIYSSTQVKTRYTFK